MRRAQTGLQRGDELARLCFAAKADAMLIQANLPHALTAAIMGLDENFHVNHLLKLRRLAGLVGDSQNSPPA